MKLLLKILFAPIIAVLAVLIWLATQLVKVSAVFMNFVAILVGLGAPCILLDGRTAHGIAGLIAALLLSPFACRYCPSFCWGRCRDLSAGFGIAFTDKTNFATSWRKAKGSPYLRDRGFFF